MEQDVACVRDGRVRDAGGERVRQRWNFINELTPGVHLIQLGPDALNLSGTRHGAERIVHRLDELGLLGDESVDEVDDGGEREAIAGGEQNYFDVLGNMDE